MTGLLVDLGTRYAALKNGLAKVTGAQEDLLHVHAGLLIFVVAALILRRKMRSPGPLIVVVVFAAANELLDWFAGEPALPLERYVDFANTVFWPAILFVLARRWR